MGDVINAGALGIEILVTGKIPSSRSKRWRFYQGYLKKCGDIAIVGVRKAYAIANLKTGAVGIQVRIMPPDIKLPDTVTIIEESSAVVEEMKNDVKKKDNKKETKKDNKKDNKKDDKKEDKKKATVKTTEPKPADKKETPAPKEEPKPAPAEVPKEVPKEEKKEEASAVPPEEKKEEPAADKE